MSSTDLSRLVLLYLFPALGLVIVAVFAVKAYRFRKELGKLKQTVADFREKLAETEKAVAAVPPPPAWYPESVATPYRLYVTVAKDAITRAKMALVSTEANLRGRWILGTEMSLEDAKRPQRDAQDAIEQLARHDEFATDALERQASRGGGN